MAPDLGEWGSFWVRTARQWMSGLLDSTDPWDPFVPGEEHLLDLLGFLAAVGDLLVHDSGCLGWGFCSVESPLCDSPWDGVWSPLLEDVVRLYLDGGDVVDALVDP